MYVIKYRALSLILCIGMLLSACKPIDMYDNVYVWGMNDEPDLSYEVPVVVPHILVDQLGYFENSSKIAVLRGEILPDTFSVWDVEQNEIVYEGNVRKKTIGAEKLGYADFSSVVEVGNYYIQSENLGRSYDFEISNQIYDELFLDAISKLVDEQNKKINVQILENDLDKPKEKIMQGGWITEENGNQEILPSAHAVTALLNAYELYPLAFKTSSEKDKEPPVLLKALKKEIEWMQKLQDETTGGVYDGIWVKENEKGSYCQMDKISIEASISYAAALAKFSYNYKEYDAEFAAGCLKLADRAFQYVIHQKIDSSEQKAILFCAATELYRASGQSKYHLKVIEFLNETERLGQDFWIICGSVTYLSTYHKVNIEYCSKLIKNIMKSAENISDKIRDDKYLLKQEAEIEISEMLWDMVILTIGNYVIQNYEYDTLLEEFQHFLNGCNFYDKSYTFIHSERSKKIDCCFREDVVLNAYYICFLSQIRGKIQ